MPLFVVLHHRQDPDQPWANEWIDDEAVSAITTTAQIGKLAEESKNRCERVFVHRCAYGGNPATISCSVEVQAVHHLPGGGSLVRFCHANHLNDIPTVSPVRGQNFY
jgi:hypothetical protein